MENAWPALWLSLKVAGWATLIDLVAGVAVGYALARLRFPGRNVLDSLLTLPMVLPPTVLGYYLLVLVGRDGTLDPARSPFSRRQRCPARLPRVRRRHWRQSTRVSGGLYASNHGGLRRH